MSLPDRPITYNLAAMRHIGAPAEMGLEQATAIPRFVWALLGQRDLVLMGTREEIEQELDDLDDKYRPAQVVRLHAGYATWVGTREVAQDPIWFPRAGQRPTIPEEGEAR